ncbi:mucin TcMUCII [Trypanosoma cruzi cruzi]|nr:mucin TcMUCII [Trypanosoma cruzi cruzi]
MVGRLVGHRESGRYNEEVLRSQGPSLTTEAGTAITGQTPVPPESLSSANDNPEPRGLATQSPHTQGATGVSDAQNKKAQENTQFDENHKAEIQKSEDQNVKCNYNDYGGTNHDDHPRTVTSSRNRRQPQQLCVGVCPAAARFIRAGVRRCRLKRCVRAVRASTQPRGFLRVCCFPM